MAQEELSPYIEQQPRDLLTADNWNEMQKRIKKDIRTTSREAAEAIVHVARADDSDRLEGLSADELKEDIVKKALDEVRARRGYLQVFRVLQKGEESLIEHGFGACPLVDVYQLDYFPVVCCEDKEEYPAWVTFYLHHSSEKVLRYTGTSGERGVVEIQPRGGPSCGIPLVDVLDRYKVSYSGDSSLGDLETEMWRAFFARPNDEFDDRQYCHSIWFDKCCREEKSVRELKRSGDWDELEILVKPRKTVNYLGVGLTGGPIYTVPQTPFNSGWMHLNLGEADANAAKEAAVATPAPTQIQVTQCGWNTVTLELLTPPILPTDWFDPEALLGLVDFPPLNEYYDLETPELKVMVLLKC